MPGFLGVFRYGSKAKSTANVVPTNGSDTESLADYVCHRLMSLPALEKVRPNVDHVTVNYFAEQAYYPAMPPSSAMPNGTQGLFVANDYKIKYYQLVTQAVSALQNAIPTVLQVVGILKRLKDSIIQEKPTLKNGRIFYDMPAIQQVHSELPTEIGNLVSELAQSSNIPTLDPNIVVTEEIAAEKNKLFFYQCYNLLRCIRPAQNLENRVQNITINKKKWDKKSGLKNFIMQCGFSKQVDYLMTLLSQYGLGNLPQTVIDTYFSNLLEYGLSAQEVLDNTRIIIEGNDGKISVSLQIKYEVLKNQGVSENRPDLNLSINMVLVWRPSLKTPMLKSMGFNGQAKAVNLQIQRGLIYLPKIISGYLPTNNRIEQFLAWLKKEYFCDEGRNFGSTLPDISLPEEEYTRAITQQIPKSLEAGQRARLVFDVLIDYDLYRQLIKCDRNEVLNDRPRFTKIQELMAKKNAGKIIGKMDQVQFLEYLEAEIIRLEQVLCCYPGVLNTHYRNRHARLTNAKRPVLAGFLSGCDNYCDWEKTTLDWRRDDYQINGMVWDQHNPLKQNLVAQFDTLDLLNKKHAVEKFTENAGIPEAHYSYVAHAVSQHGLASFCTYIADVYLFDYLSELGYRLNTNGERGITITYTPATLELIIVSMFECTIRPMDTVEIAATFILMQEARLSWQNRPLSMQPELNLLRIRADAENPAINLKDAVGYQDDVKLSDIIALLPAPAELQALLAPHNASQPDVVVMNKISENLNQGMAIKILNQLAANQNQTVLGKLLENKKHQMCELDYSSREPFAMPVATYGNIGNAIAEYTEVALALGLCTSKPVAKYREEVPKDRRSQRLFLEYLHKMAFSAFDLLYRTRVSTFADESLENCSKIEFINYLNRKIADLRELMGATNSLLQTQIEYVDTEIQILNILLDSQAS